LASRRGIKWKAADAAHPVILADQMVFDTALAALADIDPDLVATTVADRPSPTLRRRAAGFEGLVGIVVAQQVSTASAAAIFGRLQARLGALDAATVHATSDEDLKLCGLSMPKLKTLRALAAAQTSGQLDFARLATMDAEVAHAALCALRGIGPWTADVFLLFCLGHADAWPAGDLALQEAAKLVLGLDARPDTKAMIEIGERWRPLRGVAAHCLWAYYSATRKARTTLDAPIPDAETKEAG
jgi:DNA-3-methyladenine glycosylase II